MIISKHATWPLAAALALAATSAHATVVFTGAGSATEVNSTTELAYAGDVSNSDLIDSAISTRLNRSRTFTMFSAISIVGLHVAEQGK